MNDYVQQSIQSGLAFLAANQAVNGRFTGLASGSITGFHQSVTNDNIFFTALILDCLNAVDAAPEICSRAVHYLLAQRSKQWAWNYWERGSLARSYPDDLDDTACAVAGIVGYDPTLVDAVAQAKLAQVLITCETQPGGPYVTWLVPAQDQQWRDVDPAVNANVGYMLAQLGVHSQQLEDYISQCIASRELSSPYYVGIIPTLYFIARWYRGSQQAKLVQIIFDQLEVPQVPLHRAMLLTAAYNLGQGNAIKPRHIGALLRLQRQDSWPAAALYFEPPDNGQPRYAGSPELTTAFVIEALQAYRTHQQKTIKPDYRSEVADIAGVIARSLKKRLPGAIIEQLNKGSIAGWTAYTTYDDILDGDLGVESLGVANGAMRQALHHFNKALPSKAFGRFVEAAFARMDAANTWEVEAARDPETLPDYGDLTQLADRSWGHVIAPTGVLVAAGFSLSSREVKNFQRFMQQYIIAKQLCDDAHDWREDLAAGRMTAVVVMLLKSCEGSSAEAQQMHFWQYTVFEVTKHVRYHLSKAQRYLSACYFLHDTTELQVWLVSVEAVCLRVERGHSQALQFIQTCKELNLVK